MKKLTAPKLVFASAFSLAVMFNWLPAVVIPSAMAQEAGNNSETNSQQENIPARDMLRDRLMNMATETIRVMDEVNRELTAGVRDIQQANEIFDKMIEAVRNAAERSGPESDYIRNIESYISEAIRYAEEARSDRDSEAESDAERFEEYAEQLEEMKLNSLQLNSDSFRKVRIIEESKSIFVRRFRLRRIESAVASARVALDMLRRLNQEITDAASSIPSSPMEGAAE